MKWVVESSPVAITRRSRKMATFPLTTVTRWRRVGWRWACVKELHPQVCVAKGGSSSHLVHSQEVATRLPVDRPLPDDSLFVDQSKMIYLMDSQSFYCESFSNFNSNAPELRC
ncbi:unnamed protein product [Spirodela intermedia]|uniref:Uncharacterized protein n=1 Tax=Spirodela intermedia TaxID=51605 RepID=A0ABN7ED43_SPIIN|nr:unnamed protein product [Spirodela intermedia]